MSLNVLVAGKSPANAEVAKRTLVPLGHQVIPVNGMAIGLFLANKNFPHLVVTDIELVDGSGLSFLSELKRDTELRHIPVIVVCTAACDDSIRAKALAGGAEDFFCHPVTDSQFLLRVEPYLVAREGERQPDTPE